MLLEALRPRDRYTARWKWSPGFYAGGIDLTIRGRGAPPVRTELVTDSEGRKLSRNSFDTMVREVLDDTFALFSISSHRFGVRRGIGQSPPIARLEYLRSRLDDLERVVRRISDRPMRALSVEQQWLPLHKARTLTGPELERSLRAGRVAGFVTLPNRLPAAPKLPLPGRVRKTIKAVDLNLREHQEIKWALRIWANWLMAVGDRLAEKTAEDTDQRTIREAWAVRCRAMSRRVEALLRLPLFEEVADRPMPVMVSSVYRRVPAYTEFFSLYRDFNLGIAHVVGTFLQMPLARTFELYELWCFLRLLRAASNHLAISAAAIAALFQRTPDGGLTIPSSFVEVDLGHGYALAFQRTYKEYWLTGDSRGTFSRHMRPDITLTAAGRSSPEAALIVLDAKYRVESQLNDAIGDIHIYRDALVEPGGDEGVKRIVTAAYILSPMDGITAGDWKSMDLKRRLFHPEYRTAFRFGAAALRPGMSLDEVWEVLKAILSDAGVPLPPG